MSTCIPDLPPNREEAPDGRVCEPLMVGVAVDRLVQAGGKRVAPWPWPVGESGGGLPEAPGAPTRSQVRGPPGPACCQLCSPAPTPLKTWTTFTYI